jgi:threonine dehydrogenase-like Zn-dependent dehydrogenase
MITPEPVGARIIFQRGVATLAPPVPVPMGWSAARYSVVSPGTELRRLLATARGDDHAAGYMTVVDSPDGGQRLVPVPHGAAASPDDHRALPIPQATQPEHVAVARFQVMAALGLDRWRSHCRTPDSVVVVGGGPVALGCVLELKRIGVAHVVTVTRHPRPAAADLQDVTVLTEPPGGTQLVVIDCTGRPASAFAMVAPGGFLGLLGTPDDEADLSSAAVHRRGAAVVGMHELAGHYESRRAWFQTVLRWVTTAIEIDAVRGWFTMIPGEQAGSFYAALASPQRPNPPFVVLEWS